METKNQGKVAWYGYAALIIVIVFFSGVFAAQKDWLAALDFNTINGKFGTMKDAAKATYQGQGGMGARDGFMFALGIVPGVMLALGIVEVCDHLGGLRAAQKLLTPLLRPLLGIPGICGLALVSSMQSSDAGGGMTKALRDENYITEKERTTFAQFQLTAGGLITNFFSIGSAIFSFITVPIILPLAMIFIGKIVAANLMRLYLTFVVKEDI